MGTGTATAALNPDCPLGFEGLTDAFVSQFCPAHPLWRFVNHAEGAVLALPLVKIGMVGTGKWGQCLLEHFHKMACVSRVTLHKDVEKAQRLKRAYPDIEIFDTFEEMLQGDINAVVIATPIATHAHLVKIALTQGKNVFIEKPLSANPEETNELLKLSHQNGLKIFVGYTFIYDNGIAQLRKSIANGLPKLISFNWKKWGTFEENIVPNLLSHDIAILHYIIGLDKVTLTRCNIQTNQVMIAMIKNDERGAVNIQINIDRTCKEVKEKSIVLVFDDERIEKWKQGETVDNSEMPTPLQNECAAFIKMINDPFFSVPTDGEFGQIVDNFLNKLGKQCL